MAYNVHSLLFVLTLIENQNLKVFRGRETNCFKQFGKVRYETSPGEQAQLDWKESIKFETKDGEIVYVNVAVLLLSYSRFRVFHLNISKSQSVLLSFMTGRRLGGVPKVIVTDNMKTVMDEARTEHFSGTINNKFANLPKILVFKVQPCIAGRPNTKGKIEAPMKLLDEIHAYQGKFSFEELHDFVQKLCTRINQTFHQGTGKIPMFALKQEKNLLQPLPEYQEIPIRLNISL